MFALYMYDIRYSRPEAYYFWGYYFAINFLWILIPGCKCSFSIPFAAGHVKVCRKQKLREQSAR